MWSVSRQYIRSMADALREMPTFALQLYNLDLDAQALLSVHCTATPTPLQEGELVSLDRMPEPRATFEPGYMRADGSYRLSDTSAYIGRLPSLSSPMEGAYPDGAPIYPYPTPFEGMHITVSASTSQVSIWLDSAVAGVHVTNTDGSTQEHYFSADEASHILSIVPTSSGTVTVRFCASFFPGRRPRVYRVCCGSLSVMDGEDILSIQLTDDNDLACLEMPGREVTIAVSNLGRYDPREELLHPSYARDRTQAYLSMIYDGETVPIGRLFLGQYTVDQEAVQFRFGWATQPLSGADHTISTIGSFSAAERVQEIFDPDPMMVMRELWDVWYRPAAKYRIAADYTEVEDQEITMSNPLPAQPEASCLQLICNAAGWILRPGRRSYDIQILPAPIDPPGHVDRYIRYDELYSQPEYTDTGIVSGVTIEYGELGAEEFGRVAGSVTISTNRKAYVRLDAPANPSCRQSDWIYDSDGEAIGRAYYAVQGYALYAWYERDDGASYTVTPEQLAAFTCPLTVTSVDKGAVDPQTTIRNTLVDGTEVDAYWERLSERLSRHVQVTIRHRGFPELDCGDCVLVQLSPDDQGQIGHVTRNEWSYQAGVLSGSTTFLLSKEGAS